MLDVVPRLAELCRWQRRVQPCLAVPATGLRHHWLCVKVDPFSNLGAGRYSDVLTVEIRAEYNPCTAATPSCAFDRCPITAT
jgi:hypothetical protein